MTEILDAGAHYFLVEPGSKCGEEIFADLVTREASSASREAAQRTVKQAAHQIAKHLDTDGLPELRQLYDGVSYLLLHGRRRRYRTGYGQRGALA